MSEPFIGQIQPFGFNFSPRGWAKCDGQLLQISSNTALFSLLGTTYGGDGRTTFALPDLRGRAALHQGSGPGLTNRSIGQRSGQEKVTLTTQNMPSHKHTVELHALGEDGDQAKPENNLFAAGTTIYKAGTPDVLMATDAISEQDVGGNQSHENMQPFLVVNWCIALSGVFPSRNFQWSSNAGAQGRKSK